MDDLDLHATQVIQAAPLPTEGTLASRHNPVFQLLRFAAINLKMMRVILSSHGG